ncbi:VanZ family protein [Streptomyces sp. H27-D2]|uniref:VanZ family protein n=1 Tax=Streptomyces sp. H27-D2 TaxID=3046304 RepID=UPI002DBFA689|nr:VanZ family protein [Streptomyces sp. H27-D2]MEC4019526.1 VanZ family protein [Streptomyces sp. H27-D2]
MQRPGSGGITASRFRVAGRVLLAAHLLVVGWLTLRPLTVPWVTAPNLHPLAGIRADLLLAPWQAAQSLGSGLLLLAPLGVLLPMATGRLESPPLGSLARTVCTGALVSLAITVAQTGVPGRVVDVDAVLLNTVGVALAHLLLVPAARAGLRRRERAPGHRPLLLRDRFADSTALPRDDAPQGATPTIPRVGIAP